MVSVMDGMLSGQRKCVACKRFMGGEYFEKKGDRTCAGCKAIIKAAKDQETLRKERDRAAQIGKPFVGGR